MFTHLYCDKFTAQRATRMLVLGLGLGFGFVLGLEISRPRTISRTSEMQNLEKIEITVKAKVRILCPLTLKYVTCVQHCTMFC